jgi:hypothetical protein
VLLSLLLLVAALVPGPRPPRAFWAVTVSVLIYEAAYFVIAPASGFRYSWWAVAGVPLLFPLLTLRPRLRWLRDRARGWLPSRRAQTTSALVSR